MPPPGDPRRALGLRPLEPFPLTVKPDRRSVRGLRGPSLAPGQQVDLPAGAVVGVGHGDSRRAFFAVLPDGRLAVLFEPTIFAWQDLLDDLRLALRVSPTRRMRAALLNQSRRDARKLERSERCR